MSGVPVAQFLIDFGNKPRTVEYDAIPSAVFSQPPLAGVGMTFFTQLILARQLEPDELGLAGGAGLAEQAAETGSCGTRPTG